MRGRSLLGLSVLIGASLVGLAAKASAQCEYKTFPHQRQQTMKSSAGHRSGKHRAVAKAKFTCQCEHTCRSNCSAVWDPSPVCEDTGRIRGTKMHRVHSAEKIVQGTKVNAVSGGGAKCGVAYGCFIEQCHPLYCPGITISVKGEPLGVGVGVTFTANPLPFWRAEIEIPFECEECWTSRQVTDDLRERNQEYVPADDGGYGGGSGSVYRMCYWECSSWVSSTGIYEEYCVLRECLLF